MTEDETPQSLKEFILFLQFYVTHRFLVLVTRDTHLVLFPSLLLLGSRPTTNQRKS